MNYHMNSLKKRLTELHGMLKTAEVSLRKAPSHAMTIQKVKKRKRTTKAKNPAESETSKQATKAKERIKRLNPPLMMFVSTAA
jgi:phosphate uptake regulator